ncbi:MAG: hypothetical protein AB1414_19355 [bacterium]
MNSNKTKTSEEQIAYANVLNVAMWTGLSILGVTFIIYLSGVLPHFIPIEDMPKYWGMASKDFIHNFQAPTGWGWLAMVGKGDYLTFVGIVLLAGLTVLCYLVILPILIRKKDIPYVVIAIFEVAVLVLAASGILKSGGH